MVDFKCQERAIVDLQTFCKSNTHSILISGPQGSGKTYLASYYSKIASIPDIISVAPKVQDIREIVDGCSSIQNDIVLCVENLDVGVAAASYALLKLLEEPMSNIYIVITCRNENRLPDTIISRSHVTHVQLPTCNDLSQYASDNDSTKYQLFKSQRIWKSVRSFEDIDHLFAATIEQQEYLTNYPKLIESFSDVSSIQWKMGHYADNTELPLTLALRYLLDSVTSLYTKRNCIKCLDELSLGRIAKHAVLAKFILECKYGEG